MAPLVAGCMGHVPYARPSTTVRLNDEEMSATIAEQRHRRAERKEGSPVLTDAGVDDRQAEMEKLEERKRCVIIA